MANRKLNSIKFPDIADTYILDADKVNYDDSEIYASGSVGKALQNKANIDGSYEDLTAGTANQINTSVRANDKTPYIFRTSGGSVDIGDREYVNGIVGGTVAWNQLCNDSSVTVPSGHKYYMLKEGAASIGASAGTAITGLTSGTDMVFDLTQMFGTTIADCIYSLETATAGAGVAWFKKLFNKPYYAYNAGELKSVSGLVSHDMTGFNQWDEEWEVGTIDTDGNNVSANDRIRSKNYVPILPNTTYYFKGNYYRVIYFDANKVALSTTTVTDNIKTTPTDAYYLRFVVQSAYGTTYKNDICINISWDGSRDGEYEPYVKHSYPLDSDLTLRGIPKLDANNGLYYDGDVYESNGTVTRKYGIVDLGTLNYDNFSQSEARDSYVILAASKIPIKSSVNGSSVAPIVCSKFTPTYYNATWSTWQISYSSNNVSDNLVFIVPHGTYTNATAFKTAMSGVYLVYELATPTTETADPYQQTQIVDDFGTEEYVISDNTFAVPVGHDTDYPINMVAKLEMAPNSPSGDGDYIVRQTNGTNEYVSLSGNATIQDIISRLEALENA